MDMSGRKAGLTATMIAGSEELYDFFCQPCNNDGQHLPAEGYCRDCQEYLCGTCFKYHRQPSVTRHHILLDKKQMPNDKSPTKSNSKDICTDQCPKHSGKFTEYFCIDHDQLGCSACMTVSHRGCTGVSYIPDIADGIETSKDFIQLQQTLNDLKLKVEQNENKAKENTKVVNINSRETMAEIRKLRDEMNKVFDSLENEMSKKVKVIRDEDVATMSSISADCNSVKSDITSITSVLDSNLKAKKNSQVFVEMKKAERETESIEKKVAKISNDNTIRWYTFGPEKHITDLIANLKTLGNLLIETNGGQTDIVPTKVIPVSSKIIQTQSPHPSVSKGAEAPITLQTVDTKPRIAHHTADINVRLDTDKFTPWITGLAVLSDGRLAVADFNNFSIKIIDSKNNKITPIKTLPQPWNVIEVSKGQIAFTCSYKITFLTVCGTPGKSRDIIVDGLSCGIVYGQNKLIVTFSNPAKVEVMDINGTVLQRFTTDSSGKPMFECPYYTVLSQDGNTIYISDMLKLSGKVFSLTPDGQVKEMLNILSSTGLVIDKYGSVYVCQYSQNKVCQLTPGHTRVQKLLGKKDGIVRPHSVAYCDKEDKLYVGMDENDNIKVFQLK